jgi:hypothetical protein
MELLYFKIYKIYFKQILLYAVETWTMTKTGKNKLQAKDKKKSSGAMKVKQ